MRKTRLGTRRALFWRGLGRSWALLGRSLASFGALLGGSGSFLDASWVSLGRFLGPLGRLLANLRRLLSASWLSGPPRASILEGLEACWAGFGRASSVSFPAPRASSRNAFIHAMTTTLHLPALFLHPFRCGGLCAAHGIKTVSRTPFPGGPGGPGGPRLPLLPFRKTDQKIN